MAWDKEKGTPLRLFSGKEGPLNRLVLLILCSSIKPLTKYDVALEVRRVTEFKHTDKNTVYRRMDALQEQGWISKVGQRPSKPGWPSDLYAINLRGIGALRVGEKNIENFLLTANEEKLLKFNDSML